jgi:hypothetical protein
LVPIWLAEPAPDFVIAGPDLLPGLPATPAPLFVLDCANAIDEASIAASTIAIVLLIGVSSVFLNMRCGIECRVCVGNHGGLLSFLFVA